MQLFLAVLVVAIAARVAVPMPLSPVPVTLQTLAVLLVGFSLGPARGTAALALYVLAGALGLPVLAGGAGGWGAVTGGSMGYLAGMVATPLVLSRWGRRPGLRGAVVAGLAAHGVVLALGAGWLVVRGTSPLDALTHGVVPFLPGMALKSLVAGLLAVTLRR